MDMTITWNQVYDLVVTPSTAVGLAAYPVLQRTLRIVVFLGAALALLEKFGVLAKILRFAGKLAFRAASFVFGKIRKRSASRRSVRTVARSLLIIPVLSLFAACAQHKTLTVDMNGVVEKFGIERSSENGVSDDICAPLVERSRSSLRECSNAGSGNNLDSSGLYSLASKLKAPVKTAEPSGSVSSMSIVDEAKNRSSSKVLDSDCSIDWKMSSVALTECLSDSADSIFFNPFSIFGEYHESKD